jgi:hypothetical protein
MEVSVRRIIALGVALSLLLSMSGCDPAQDGKHSTPQKPRAGNAPPPVNPGHAQPAPVQGDPSAHNTQPGEIDLSVEWASENKRTPACEWSLNAPGQGHVCENLKEGKQESPGEDYFGLWEYTWTGKPGDVVFLTAQGNFGNKWIKCFIYWKGAPHELPAAGNHCGGTYTLS